MSNMGKFLSSQNILVGIVIVVLVGAIYSYSGSKGFLQDGMYSSGSGSVSGFTAGGEPTLRHSAAQNVAQMPQQPQQLKAAPPSGYTQKNVANPAELLPTDQNNAWAKLNPNAGQNQVIIPDLLEAGYHIGLDTIGQTLKNPNLQERSEPIIPKQLISPWNNSSFEPDIARVPLELGYGCN